MYKSEGPRLSKKLQGLPTLAEFRKAGISLPMTGTYEFNLLLKRLTTQVQRKYTPHQVKIFLTKASHSYHATPDKGKSTRGGIQRASTMPAKHWREMGRKRQGADNGPTRIKTYNS